MNFDEANRKARDLFGEYALATEIDPRTFHDGRDRFRILLWDVPPVILGSGPTWEKAFQNADDRRQK